MIQQCGGGLSGLLHFDFNTVKPKTLEDFINVLDSQLSRYENLLELVPTRKEDFAVRLTNLIQTAHDKFQRNAVLLVDEYDKPLLNSIHDKQLLSDISTELKSFYGVVKSMDQYIRFAMFTGVARFSKVSIFSDLNNLLDISLSEAYNSICGISETELIEHFSQTIQEMADRKRITFDEMTALLRR